METVDTLSSDSVLTRSKPALHPKPKPRKLAVESSTKAEEDILAHEIEELHIVVENVKMFLFPNF